MSLVHAVVAAVREHVHRTDECDAHDVLAERYASALRALDMSVCADDASRIVRAHGRRHGLVGGQHRVAIAVQGDIGCPGFRAEIVWSSDASDAPVPLDAEGAVQVLAGWLLEFEPERDRARLLAPGTVRVLARAAAERRFFAVDGDALVIQLRHHDTECSEARASAATDRTGSAMAVVSPRREAWAVRRQIQDPALRFFLAVLALVTDRETLLRVLASRHGGDPVDTLVDRVARLAPHLWQGLGAEEIELSRPVLAGASLSGFLTHLAESYDPDDIRAQADILEDYFYQLRKPTLLWPIFVSQAGGPPRLHVPLERQPAADQPAATADHATDHEAERAILHPGMYIQESGRVPADIATAVASADLIAEARPVVWVEEPGTGVTMPYWPDESCARAIRDLYHGRITIADLDPDIRRALERTGIVRPHGERERLQSHWDEQCALVRSQLHERRYAPLRQLASPAALRGLSAHIDRLHDQGHFARGDGQVALRDVMHNEASMRHLHGQLGRLMARVIPGYKPSYSYLVRYRGGAVLRRHTDREQCAYNLSMVIAHEPETSLAESWPICFAAHGQTHRVYLGPGDGVLYAGTEVPHWREELASGHRLTACIFHFVPTDFTGTLD